MILFYILRNWRFYLSTWIVRQGRRICEHNIPDTRRRCAACGEWWEKTRRRNG